MRELNRRGVAAQVVTVGLGSDDGREEFPGVPFRSLSGVSDVSGLGGTVVFVAGFPVVPTVNPAYQIMHIPPPLRDAERQQVLAQTANRGLIATSRFAARLWSEFLDVDVSTIQVVYPFAEPCFGVQPRPEGPRATVRILFAGRLSPEKGIYTLLEMLHSDLIAELRAADVRVTFTVTTAGADKPQGRIIRRLLEAHAGIRLVAARKTPQAMAELMVDHDVVVMPSNSQYWHETFGIVSIEAQHAGCRVVASNDGGLPETDCGAVTLVVPDDAEALARGVLDAVRGGPLQRSERRAAGARFTVEQSVDDLLNVFARPRPVTPNEVLEELETLVQLPPATHQSRPLRPASTRPAPTAALPLSRRPDLTDLMAKPSGGERHERQVPTTATVPEVR